MLVLVMVIGAAGMVGCKSGDTTKTSSAPPAPTAVSPAPLDIRPLPESTIAPPRTVEITPLPESKKTTPSKTIAPPKITKSKTTDTVVVGAGKKYVVKKGDSLTQIAKNVYGDAKKFKQIAMANKITDVNKIRAGQVLVIP
jgi:nucleoid-associated protein YgaU